MNNWIFLNVKSKKVKEKEKSVTEASLNFIFIAICISIFYKMENFIVDFGIKCGQML